MNIILNCQNNSSNYHKRLKPVTFSSIPKASYKLFKNTGDVTIYQLGKSDISFLEYLKKNIISFFKQYDIADDAKREIIEKSLNGSVDFLKDDKNLQTKVKVLLAVVDSKPCGLLVGNGLKVASKSGNLVYSSRKNMCRNETELDFLATWASEKHKGVGLALIDEYFRSVKADGFNSIYVRSEVPQYSGAALFYSKLGFKELNGNRQRFDLKKGDNPYLTGEYFDSQDLVVPMKITSSKINSAITLVSEKMHRREPNRYISGSLFNIVSFV